MQTLLYAAIAILLGFQAIAFAVFTKLFAISEGLHPPDRGLDRLFRYITLEVGLLVGAALALAGLAGSFYALGLWGAHEFGRLDISRTLRLVIPSALALTLGVPDDLHQFLLERIGSETAMTEMAEFDHFADTYDSDLNHALSVSGEDKDYFARGRLSFLASCLRTLQESPRSAMDYGCGVGGTVPLLPEIVGVERVIGIDISQHLLERAQKTFGSDTISFQTTEQYQLPSLLDLAYCNGVFHHIPVNERASALQYVYRSLRPGGLFAFWENNPWSPAARYVMAQCAFDRDAVMLTSLEARRLLRDAGFQILRTDFHFYFPRRLRFLRFVEAGLTQASLRRAVSGPLQETCVAAKSHALVSAINGSDADPGMQSPNRSNLPTQPCRQEWRHRAPYN